jgi:ATP-dependent Lon protease
MFRLHGPKDYINVDSLVSLLTQKRRKHAMTGEITLWKVLPVE